MTRPNVALIGCGQWGRNLARNLSALGALAAVSDPSPVVLEGVRALYPGVAVTADPATLLHDDSVEAFVIATPAAFHYEMARQALEAGKHVMVEKPLALAVAEAQALAELADARGRVLMVGHLLEYHPAVEKLRALVSRGELGKIQYCYSSRLNLGRIRTEENALWSFAPHDIHVLLRLLHEEPVEVTSQGGTYLTHQVADVTLSALVFQSGVRAHIFVSWLHPFKEHKLVVVGDRKMAVFDDTLPVNKLSLYPHRVEWIERVPVAVKAEAEAVSLPDVEPLEAECRHFLECVATGRRPRTDGANGVAVLRVLEACQRSLERGGAPVPVGASRPAAAATPLMNSPRRRITDSPRSADNEGGMGEPRFPHPDHSDLNPSPNLPAPVRYHAHPTAIIDPGADIGEGTRIWHYCHVMTDSRIGRACSLGQNVFVARTVVIGDNVKIQNNVSVYEGVVLEDDVFCGPSMVFTNVLNPRSHVSRKHEFRQTLVRRGATLGANSTVVCGHVVGRFAFIGAGAVVTRDVPDHALVLGAPGRTVGWMCECGVRLPLHVGAGEEEGTCPKCGKTYTRKGDRVRERP